MAFKIYAKRGPWGNDIEFQLGRLEHRGGERFSIATNLNMQELEPGDAAPETPLFRLDPTEAQALMDQLWQCGLRPSEGSGSAGSLAATERHLEDMRSLALHWCLRDELGGLPKP